MQPCQRRRMCTLTANDFHRGEGVPFRKNLRSLPDQSGRDSSKHARGHQPERSRCLLQQATRSFGQPRFRQVRQCCSRLSRSHASSLPWQSVLTSHSFRRGFLTVIFSRSQKVLIRWNDTQNPSRFFLFIISLMLQTCLFSYHPAHCFLSVWH